MGGSSSVDAKSRPPEFDMAAAIAALTGEQGSTSCGMKVIRLVSLNPLLNAAANDDVEEARSLLARGADPNLADEEGWGPLHHAAFSDSKRVLQLLLAHPRVKVNLESGWRWRALDVCRSAEAARALLDAGAKTSAAAPGCLSALHHAAYSARDDVVEVLLSRGANVREKFAARAVMQAFKLDLEGEALHLAAFALNGVQAVMERTAGFAALGAPAGVRNAHTTATRRVAVVNALLRAGADVTARATGHDLSIYYPMPLHLAAQAGDAGVVRALLAGGAPVDATEASMGMTALAFAAHEGHTDAIYALAAGGADVNSCVDVNGVNVRPVEVAMTQNRHAAVTALLELGADTSQMTQFLGSPVPDDAMRALLARFVACGRAPPPARECALPGCQARRRAAYDDAKLMICAACKTVAYCCKEHQRKHWPAHKAACNAARDNA